MYGPAPKSDSEINPSALTLMGNHVNTEHCTYLRVVSKIIVNGVSILFYSVYPFIVLRIILAFGMRIPKTMTNVFHWQ